MRDVNGNINDGGVLGLLTVLVIAVVYDADVDVDIDVHVDIDVDVNVDDNVDVDVDVIDRDRFPCFPTIDSISASRLEMTAGVIASAVDLFFARVRLVKT
eukprot:CAMPEP_0184347018 /NCGR_PEP_ID=MMETSP1089-20130417/15182_1 /TAXON_ID=38269 ORGANISM="Gloeochaete wittrockiana, Strain SAG46.84" /NCGR_SAMPLE_ID=MMETSP1089 /ASSEMBLY_ACC=CAM_ASM_000445 /LENGTH=99 /DNA_ID=CAMNT_0026677917 /DNA_START=359 /DNA_END=658 /DNA_ORIENTATION=-